MSCLVLVKSKQFYRGKKEIMKIKKLIFLYFVFVAKIMAESHEARIDNYAQESLMTFFEYIFDHEEEKNTEFFDSLTRCYDQLKKGNQSLCIGDLLIASPLLIAYCDEYIVGESYKSVSCDIGPIILLLNALKAQINQLGQDQFNCCQLLQSDFQETFSILFEVTQSFSTFDATVALLVDTIATLTNSITSFTGIPLSIAVLQDTVEMCCDTINSEFQQTWTILGNTLNVVNNCCNSISNDFNGTWTFLNAEFNQVFNMLSTVTLEELCQPTAIIAPTTIILPGSYCLATNITGTIIINANDVVLDLNNHTIFNGQIIISGKNNSIVCNGILDNATTGSCAISITNCSNVILDALMVINPNDGIQCGQSTNIVIKNCIISGAQKNGLTIINTSTALRIEDFEIINTTSNAIYINANVQDLTLQNGHIKFSNGIRAETGFSANNIKCIDIFVEGTPITLFPMNFLGTSSNFFFYNVQIADAGQGMQFNNISQSLFQNCVVKNISTPASSAGSAFRIDNGVNNKFDNCVVLSMTTTGSTTLDAFKMTNVNNLIFKECSVEGINGVNGVVNGFSSNNSQRITMQDCVVHNITTSTQADGFHLQATSNVIMTDCVANGCSSNGYFSSGGANITVSNCIANNCLADGFHSASTTNVLYEYCYSNNNTGVGFNVANAICGNCESSRNVGFGFNGNSSSIAYNCFAGLNITGAYTAMTDSVQALDAGSPKVGYSISA